MHNLNGEVVKMENPEDTNEHELMSFYGYSGRLGSIRLKLRLIRSWLLQWFASISPSSDLAVIFQRARGVNIGNHVYIGPNVHIDLLYPHLVTLGDYVSIGMYSMIFAHSNPTCSMYLKEHFYPRTVLPVIIKKGAWVPPGTIILNGVTIGENSVIGAGSLVLKDVKPYTIAAGVPAKFIKDLVSKTEEKENQVV
jgi:acetyltransferase-like isoleucine patch superfamily enzyme